MSAQNPAQQPVN